MKILVFLTVCLILLSGTQTVYALFGVNVNVSDLDSGGTAQESPSIAVDASGDVFVAWEDERNGNYDIYFSKSTDGGASWSTDIQVNDDTDSASQYNPSIAVDDLGNIFVAWYDYRNSNHDIYFSKSTDGGTTWSTNVRVNDDISDTNQLYPSIAVDASGNIFIAWYDKRNGDRDIYSSKSIDGGMTWGTNVQVNDDTGSASVYNPSITVDASGNVFVAWSDIRSNSSYDIYFSKSTDGGTTWSTNIQVNDDTGSAIQRGPSIAVDSSGNIFMVWPERRIYSSDDIYFSKSTDGGTTWSANVRVNDDTDSASQYNPSIAVDGSGNVFVAWNDIRNGYWDIFFSKSLDGGATWSTDIQVNDDTVNAYQFRPSIAVDGPGNVYLVWYDNRDGNSDIFFASALADEEADVEVSIPAEPEEVDIPDTPAPTPQITSQPVSKEIPATQKKGGICGPTVVVLLAMMVLVFRRRITLS